MASLKDQVEQLNQSKRAVLQMGGDAEVTKQHSQGKLTVRERLALLFDSNTFVEFGALAVGQFAGADMKGRSTPADGVVTGWGLIDGRKVLVIANDFTVIAGSIGEVGERKAERMRELAMVERVPLVWLLDSAGARIQEIASSRFAMTGRMFYDQVMLSGVVPQVAALMGPCAAGTAYVAALADFVPMVKGTSSMALAGAPLVKAVIGEDITTEDLGGSKVHCEVSGVGDLEVADDRECIATVRKYLSYFPSDSSQQPADVVVKPSGDQASDRLARLMSGDVADENRLPDEILELLPDSPRKFYDMRKLIKYLVDGGDFLEMKPKFGQGLITALARIGSKSVGIVASQPSYKGGVIDVDESDKAARFINLCDAFNIPLVFLQDVPGFMVGSEVEKKGIIRHGAKFLFAVSRASVPKVTVLIRKAYGAGYYVMGGRAFGTDTIVAWPSAEVSLMGAEGAVNIIFRKEIEKADDPLKKREEYVELYQNKIALEMAAGGAYIDDVIDPRDTRKIIIEALKTSAGKKPFMLPKKHGVEPV